MFFVTAIAAAGFWRCGRHFTKAGILVDAADFSKEHWARIKSEAMLRVKEASAKDVEAHEASGAVSDELPARIADAIGALGKDDFDKNGAPNLKAIKERLEPEFAERLTQKLRNQVWKTVQENQPNPPATSET